MQDTLTYLEHKLSKLKKGNQKQARRTKELLWATTFHDTIRQYPHLQSLSLSPGRMAANYSLLYILTRILLDIEPKSILEFGLGESSKLISTHLRHTEQTTPHVIIEHEQAWIENFQKRFLLPENTKIEHYNLKYESIHGHKVRMYEGFPHQTHNQHTLYIVDGASSKRYSRFDIYRIAEQGLPEDFIIILDDYHRLREKGTGKALLQLFKKQGIEVVSTVYSGAKDQLLITTPNYRFLSSL